MLGSFQIPKHIHKLMFMTFSWFHEAVAELLNSKADVRSAQARPLQVTNCLPVKLCPFSIQDDVLSILVLLVQAHLLVSLLM